MLNSRVVAATLEHALAMAPRMREADRAECWALARLSPIEALQLSIETAVYAWTWLVDDEPACIFGVGTRSMIGETGVPWLLSTDLVAAHPMPFLRRYREYLAAMLKAFPHLSNVVDSRYATCVEWLKWLGFEVHDAIPMGPDGVPFHLFEMRA
ncbi:hypothetical protein BX589_12067 [Paraburkholderia fungorum]|jgi:hypothetical protein|uniref:hypothetical protein n=1 Tax=Paraburkholderia fungorum TaxID=134537 RepID=UPI000D4D8A08|nr:hypothetical protein [Paraburkholderia fungorum]PRZ51226.1 hypothetical protein BX589_12067 [Paraburkholderia fungorum]